MNLDSVDKNDIGYHPLFIVILILSFHILIFFQYQESFLNQITLRDFDGYFHLIRTKDLYKFGNTYETTFLRSNAPYGEILHWTSAFDFLLYAGAYIGSFFVNFNVALLWWSIFVNPILHALTFLVLFWGLRDFIGHLRASIFGILFAFQLYYFGIFDISVPDHHGFQIFLFSFFLACVIKSIMSTNGIIYLICGIVGGLSIWLGIESIAVVLIASLFFVLLWILYGKIYQSKNFLFSFGLLLTCSITFLFDTRYSDLMKTVYDRLSIVHVFAFLTITVFWALVALLNKWTNVLEKHGWRITVAIIGAVVCILLISNIFPLIFKNPLSEATPVIKLIYLNQTTEFTGLFSQKNNHSEISFVYWAMTLPALPIGIYLSFRTSSKEKKEWIFIALINIVYIFLSVFIFRMIIYALLCSLIPVSYVVSHLFIFIKKKYIFSYYKFIRTFFIFICCVALIAPSIVFKSKQPNYLIGDKIFLSHICQYLNNDPFFNKKPRRILTSIYLGPLILYKTQHEVIGTTSHRNVSGILDTYYVMNATKEKDAHTIIHRRGIQVLLIGKPEYGLLDYFIDDSSNRKKSGEIFHHQLWEGKIPTWMQSYPVPKSFEGKIKIFRITR